jgi:hypothetical protein
MLTQDERNILYQQPKFVYIEDLVWQYSYGSDRIVAPIFSASGEEILELRATKGSRGQYSFALLTRKKELIRRWDFRVHTNPGDQKTDKPHKHYWTPEYGENMTYDVLDIPTNDVNAALFAFLKECNIKIEGSGAYEQILF